MNSLTPVMIQDAVQALLNAEGGTHTAVVTESDHGPHGAAFRVAILEKPVEEPTK